MGKLIMLRKKVALEKDFIKNNSGIRGFLFGKEPKNIVMLRQKGLDDLCSQLLKLEEEYSAYSLAINDLRDKRNKLKTTKEMERLSKSIYMRAGLYPSRSSRLY